MQIAPQWMKLDTNIFNHKKIKKIRRMPDGDSLFTLWIYLICEGMKNITNPGVIEYSSGIPADMNDISEDCYIKLSVVQMGVDLFVRLGMIFPNEDGCITVKNLAKHQSLDRLQYQRELSRQRQIKYRSKNKALQVENDNNVTRDKCVSNEQDKIRIEKKRKEKSRVDKIIFEDFWNLYDYKKARPLCEKKWKKLSLEDQQNILIAIPAYKESTPDKRFRKHPFAYLNQRAWEDEIIVRTGNTINNKTSEIMDNYNKGKELLGL